MHPRGRRPNPAASVSARAAFGALAAFVIAGTVLAGCGGGGGGQLAQGGSTPTNHLPPPGPGEPAPSTVQPVPVSELPSPRSAAAVTKELSVVEPRLRTGDESARSLRRLGRRQQQAYRALAAHPGWITRVVAGVPGPVRDAVQANVDAAASLASLTPSDAEAPTDFPAWQIVAPEPASTLRAYYDEAERASGISWTYLAAIHLVESRLGRIRGPSSAGAQGPMQFIPTTWASYGEGDITSNHDAIQAAGRYLAARGGPTDMPRALFSYNNDDRYVAAVQGYASVLQADPDAFAGYHEWQVFYATRNGVFLLPEGYHHSA